MKNIIHNLKMQLEALNQLIENRYETFTNRTEAWQLSAKGENYDNDTSIIETQVEELEVIIDTLEDL